MAVMKRFTFRHGGRTFVIHAMSEMQAQIKFDALLKRHPHDL